VRGPVGRLAPRPRTPLPSRLGAFLRRVAMRLGAEYFARPPLPTERHCVARATTTHSEDVRRVTWRAHGRSEGCAGMLCVARCVTNDLTPRRPAGRPLRWRSRLLRGLVGSTGRDGWRATASTWRDDASGVESERDALVSVGYCPVSLIQPRRTKPCLRSARGAVPPAANSSPARLALNE